MDGDDALLSEYPDVKFFEDDSLQSGDCQIKSRFGLLDGRIATKLRKIEEELRGNDFDSLNERFSFMEQVFVVSARLTKLVQLRKLQDSSSNRRDLKLRSDKHARLLPERHNQSTEAQVVGFRENSVLLMALESVHLIHPGCKVISKKNSNSVPHGSSLLGRIIDGMGRPIDGKGPLLSPQRRWFSC